MMVQRSSSLLGVGSVGLLLPKASMLSHVTTGTPAFSALSCMEQLSMTFRRFPYRRSR